MHHILHGFFSQKIDHNLHHRNRSRILCVFFIQSPSWPERCRVLQRQRRYVEEFFARKHLLSDHVPVGISLLRCGLAGDIAVHLTRTDGGTYIPFFAICRVAAILSHHSLQGWWDTKQFQDRQTCDFLLHRNNYDQNLLLMGEILSGFSHQLHDLLGAYLAGQFEVHTRALSFKRWDSLNWRLSAYTTIQKDSPSRVYFHFLFMPDLCVSVRFLLTC